MLPEQLVICALIILSFLTCPIDSTDPINALKLFLKSNSGGKYLVFRLDKGNRHPAFTTHLTTCSLLVADAEDDGSLVIIPFSDSVDSGGLPREVTHQVFSEKSEDISAIAAAQKGDNSIEQQPGSEQQVLDGDRNKKLKVSASCICNAPDYSKPITLTSNALFVIPGVTEPDLKAETGEGQEGWGGNHYEVDDDGGNYPEEFSDDQIITICMVAAVALLVGVTGTVTFICISRRHLFCLDSPSQSQQELNTEDTLAELRRIVREQKARQQHLTDL